MDMNIRSAADLAQVLTKMHKEAELMAEEIAKLKSGSDNGQLRADYNSIIAKIGNLDAMVKAGWKEGRISSGTGFSRADYTRLGEMFKAVAAHNTAKVQELGGAVGTLEMQEKATGTPLTADATTGSYIVPVQYFGEILRIAKEKSELYPKVNVVQMRTRTGYFPKKNAGVSFTRVTSDAGSVTEANPTFTQVALATETWALYVAVTEALMEDDNVMLGQYLVDIIGEAWIEMFDGNFLNHASNPTGLLTAATTNLVAMAPGGTGFDSADIDDLDSLIAKLTTRGKRRNAHWFMHPTILDHFATRKNAVGDYILTPPTAGSPRALRGYPIILSDEMPDIGDSAAATEFIAFGDPRQMIFAERLGMEVKYYDQTLSAVQYIEAFFRARIRADWELAHEDSFAVLKTAAA